MSSIPVEKNFQTVGQSASPTRRTYATRSPNPARTTALISGSSDAAYACICARSQARFVPSCSMYAWPIACMASSPRLPSAARWKSSSVSRKQRVTLALYSSFFVPKRRKR